MYFSSYFYFVANKYLLTYSHSSLYSTKTLYHLCQPCKILILVFIVLKHCIICIFLIHSDNSKTDFVFVLEYTFFQLCSNVEKSLRFTRFRGSYVNHPAVVLIKVTLLFCLIVYRKCGLPYLFKLVWNTQKTTWASTKERCLLTFKMFWCLNALSYCFFPHIFEVKESNFY